MNIYSVCICYILEKNVTHRNEEKNVRKSDRIKIDRND